MLATKSHWDDTIISALHLPLSVLIWVLGLSFAAQLVADKTQVNVAFFQALVPLRQVAIIAIIVWFAIRFVTRVEARLVEKRTPSSAVDETTVHAISQIVRVAVFITAILIILQTFGIKLTGLLAVSGVGAIAIGFAAKEMLGNFFGGLMIFLDRPFAVGDWIRSPDKNIEGTVENIGWRLTRIRTFDKRPLYVPNGTFSVISVENPSRMLNRRIKTNIGIRYDDAKKMGVIVEDIEEMLRNHPEIDNKQTMFVKFVNFGPSALEFLVYTFTKTTNWVKFQAIQQDVFLKIIDIIDNHGAECAFPTTTLHVPEGVRIRSQQ